MYLDKSDLERGHLGRELQGPISLMQMRHKVQKEGGSCSRSHKSSCGGGGGGRTPSLPQGEARWNISKEWGKKFQLLGGKADG